MCQAGNGSASFSILAFELEHATPVCRRLSWYLGIRMNDDDTRETDFVLKYVCLWVRVRVCARVEIVSCQIVRGTTMTICCTCPILNKHLHSMAAAFAWHHAHKFTHTFSQLQWDINYIMCLHNFWRKMRMRRRLRNFASSPIAFTTTIYGITISLGLIKIPPNTRNGTHSHESLTSAIVDVHILISVNRADIENPRVTNTRPHASTSKATKSVDCV